MNDVSQLFLGASLGLAGALLSLWFLTALLMKYNYPSKRTVRYVETIQGVKYLTCEVCKNRQTLDEYDQMGLKDNELFCTICRHVNLYELNKPKKKSSEKQPPTLFQGE